jgi:hypothetical protein
VTGLEIVFNEVGFKVGQLFSAHLLKEHHV